jgi:endogenous inhibitor of DNA gyrase (YacG/DUF329 family)
MATTVKCPTCRRPVAWSEDSTYRPFCSDRCRLIDLGAWLTEQHKIPDESGTEAGTEDTPGDPENHAA